MCTTGRRARWSMSGSPSKVATSSVRLRRQQRRDGAVGAEPGVDPSVERHHQHRVVEDGLLVSLVEGRALWAHVGSPALTAPPRGSRPPARPGPGSGAKSADGARVSGGRPPHVPGVDALEDAGQLPVAEGDVEVEVGEVTPEARHSDPDLGAVGEPRDGGGRHAEQRAGSSPGSVQYTISSPRSARGSPRVQISQSSTARTCPSSPSTVLSRR